MKIGIEFFDRHEPKPGDLWIVASGPAMGKTTVLRNLAVSLADHLGEGYITYWDLEHTYATWRDKIEKMGCAVPVALTYRNDSAWLDGYGGDYLAEPLNHGAPPGTVAVVIDQFDLYARREDVDIALKALKIWLVRTGRFGLVSMQLPRDVWGTMKAEGRLNPDALPEHMLDNGDAVFACGKTPKRALDHGDADTLRVVVCKTPTGLRDDQHTYHAFIWNHTTGRIS